MTRIYGHSDDLIEVEGDLFHDEVGLDDAEATTIAASNGLMATIRYGGEGEWRISVDHWPALADVEGVWVSDLGHEGAPNGYTQVLNICGKLDWVLIGGTKADPKE